MSARIDPKDAKSGQKIELYVKHTCPSCKEARAFYDARGIGYTVHDAQNDRAVRARMFELTGDDPTVPTIVIDGVYVQSGWGNPPRG